MEARGHSEGPRGERTLGESLGTRLTQPLPEAPSRALSVWPPSSQTQPPPHSPTAPSTQTHRNAHTHTPEVTHHPTRSLIDRHASCPSSSSPAFLSSHSHLAGQITPWPGNKSHFPKKEALGPWETQLTLSPSWCLTWEEVSGPMSL